jgi:phage terminase large subunit GpA-like protein
MGAKIRFSSVSAHRRACYRLGEVPNKFAAKYSSSPILLLTCTVDVHKRNLAVTVLGWTAGMRSYVIDYWRFEARKTGRPYEGGKVWEGADEPEYDCGELTSPVWGRLRELLEEKIYKADDGKKYRITFTLIDAGYANSTVADFCGQYSAGVYPILGRDRPGKNQKIKEFSEFTTQAGKLGYLVVVDHYKDRLAPVLRREWVEEAGTQNNYHFNAPTDLGDKQLKELTAETRKEKTDDKGRVTYFWDRPKGRDNELWDNLGYGHAAVEILAWALCIQHFELETIDWPQFWEYLEKEKLYFTE